MSELGPVYNVSPLLPNDVVWYHVFWYRVSFTVCNVSQGRRKVPRSGAAIYRAREAADNFSSARSVENFLTYLFFTYEETALIASRYVEGHALTLCIYTVTV